MIKSKNQFKYETIISHTLSIKLMMIFKAITAKCKRVILKSYVRSLTIQLVLICY